ncbi:MAG: hypothetical protein AAFO95_15695 [Cyanobacteria bacterium J06600_6]
MPNKKFNVKKLNATSSILGKLDIKPKVELTLRESIYYLRSKLNAARRKGYSYEDLSHILSEQNIVIAPGTLKLYLKESLKKSNLNKALKKQQIIKHSTGKR